MLESQRQQAASNVLRTRAAELMDAHALMEKSHERGLDALEAAVNNLWADYLAAFEETCATSLPARLGEKLDREIRTDRDEYMDRADFPENERERSVRDLHRLNKTIGTYRRALSWVEPMLMAARQREGRRPRLLDIASGHGGFPIELASLAGKKNFDVEVTGSDIQPGHMEGASRRAKSLGVSAGFRVLNAFDMSDVRKGDYDVVMILQAMHHFRPGQLARMIAESVRIAGTGFIGIDIARSPALPFFLAGQLFLYSGNYYFAYDGYLSARKSYDRTELELIARAAAPGARIGCRTRLPAFNVLEVVRPD